jgi:hypothetical protein
MDINDGHLVYTATPSAGVSRTYHGTTTAIAVQRAATVLDAGGIPLAFGGTWTFSAGCLCERQCHVVGS